MHRLSAAIPAAFALMCLASPVPAAEDKTWDREFTVSRQPTIRIESDDAEVTVRSWKGSRVKVIDSNAMALVEVVSLTRTNGPV